MNQRIERDEIWILDINRRRLSYCFISAPWTSYSQMDTFSRCIVWDMRYEFHQIVAYLWTPL